MLMLNIAAVAATTVFVDTEQWPITIRSRLKTQILVKHIFYKAISEPNRHAPLHKQLQLS